MKKVDHVMKENSSAKYSKEELNNLKKFVESVKNDSNRATFACWGNGYSKGW